MAKAVDIGLNIQYRTQNSIEYKKGGKAKTVRKPIIMHPISNCTRQGLEQTYKMSTMYQICLQLHVHSKQSSSSGQRV